MKTIFVCGWTPPRIIHSSAARLSEMAKVALRLFVALLFSRRRCPYPVKPASGRKSPASGRKTPASGRKTVRKSTSAKAGKISNSERRAGNRKYVIMCAIDMRPDYIAYQRGFKLFLGHFAPEYATNPMQGTTFNDILTDLRLEVKDEIVRQLKSQRESCLEHGHDGPFCGIQIALTTVGHVEYCTASCSIIPPNFGERLHLTLSARAFPGHHTYNNVKLWLQQVIIVAMSNVLMQYKRVFEGDVTTVPVLIDMEEFVACRHHRRSEVGHLIGRCSSGRKCRVSRSRT